MSRAAILTGATIASVARTTFTLILVTFVGLAVGFRFHTPVSHIALGFVVAIAFGYAFAWFFTLVGLLVRSTEAAQLAAFLPIFPLVFAASTFTSTVDDAVLAADVRRAPADHAGRQLDPRPDPGCRPGDRADDPGARMERGHRDRVRDALGVALPEGVAGS